MTNDLITQDGDLIGSRITVYDLLPQFLDPTATEPYLCRLYELTPEQVAAARAYVFNNLETVLTRHLKIEERIAAGNAPRMVEAAERTRAALRSFKEWLTEREQAERAADSDSGQERNGRSQGPNFREWLAGRETLVGEGS